jgi:hypothetical protein
LQNKLGGGEINENSTYFWYTHTQSQRPPAL